MDVSIGFFLTTSTISLVTKSNTNTNRYQVEIKEIVKTIQNFIQSVKFHKYIVSTVIYMMKLR